MNKFDLVICDMAGTTINDRDEVYRVLREATEREGAKYTDAQFQDHMGMEKRSAISELLKIGGIEADEERIDAAFDWFTEELRRTYTENPPTALPGVETALKDLRSAGVQVALTTGFSREITDVILGAMGWRPGEGVIDISVAGDEVAQGRPAPDMILKAIEVAGVEDKGRVISCGDTQADVASAQRAGVTSVGVLTGHLSREDFEELGADVILDSASELPGAVLED